MIKNGGERFTENDIQLLNEVSQNLKKVFISIQEKGYLQSKLSSSQALILARMAKILDKTFKNQCKEFFRELLNLQHGQVNVLNNKILRKNINYQM